VTDGTRYAYLAWFGHGGIHSLQEDNQDLSINARAKWMRKIKKDAFEDNSNPWPNKVNIGEINLK